MGDFDAVKIGRNWVTTESGIKDYMESVTR